MNQAKLAKMVWFQFFDKSAWSGRLGDSLQDDLLDKSRSTFSDCKWIGLPRLLLWSILEPELLSSELNFNGHQKESGTKEIWGSELQESFLKKLVLQCGRRANMTNFGFLGHSTPNTKNWKFVSLHFRKKSALHVSLVWNSHHKTTNAEATNRVWLSDDDVTPVLGLRLKSFNAIVPRKIITMASKAPVLWYLLFLLLEIIDKSKITRRR